MVEKRRTSGPDLVEACNHSYTRIPHDFGIKTPPLVRTREEVKLQLQLLEALGNIQVAFKLPEGLQGKGSLVDQEYLQLGVLMEPLTGGPVRKLAPATGYILDKLTISSSVKESASLVRMLVAALASGNHAPEALTSLVTEVKAKVKHTKVQASPNLPAAAYLPTCCCLPAAGTCWDPPGPAVPA